MENSQPQVSIIIPFFNHENFIEETLESVQKQTFQNFEIIIVDDCSCEKAKKKLTEIAKKNSEIQIFYNSKNKGPSFCRNYGIKKSKGKYILPLDSDDKLDPKFIKKCLSFLEKNKFDFVITYLKNFGKLNNIWKPKINLYELLFNGTLPYCAIFKKNIFEKTGGYDENFKEGFEDWEFWIRVLKENFQGHIIAEPLFFYRNQKISRLQKTHILRPKLIKRIRKKHFDLYKNQKNIKKNWPGYSQINCFFHNIHYRISCVFPKFGVFLMKLYFMIKR